MDVLYMSKEWLAFKAEQYEEQDKNVKYLKIKKPETSDEYYANNLYLGDKDKVLREIKHHLEMIALRKRSDEAELKGARTLEKKQRISEKDFAELQKKIATKAEKIYAKLVKKNKLREDDYDYDDYNHPDDAQSYDGCIDIGESSWSNPTVGVKMPAQAQAPPAVTASVPASEYLSLLSASEQPPLPASESASEQPPPPPAIWSEHMSTRRGAPYWFNSETGERLWTRPPTLGGKKTRKSVNGKTRKSKGKMNKLQQRGKGQKGQKGNKSNKSRKSVGSRKIRKVRKNQTRSK
jgi:hypothetical protein